MAETVVKTELTGLAHVGDGDTAITEGQQLITVQTPSDEQQLIMVTFSGADGQNTTDANHVYVSNVTESQELQAVEQHACDMATQTETVFGLEDLPTVKEMVRKTIAKTKKLEMEQQRQDIIHGPVNGIYTCTICARVYRNKISWQNHLATHNGNEVYMCGVCGQLFNIRITLKAHLDVHVREEKKIKRQRNAAFSSAEMKVGGVYMPGDVIPKDDEKILNKHFGLDSNVSHTDDSGSYVAATEEVSNDQDDFDDDSPDFLTESTSDKPDNPEPRDTEPESNFIYACNICGEQYPVKEDCEKHLRIHTGGAEPDTDADDQPVDKSPLPSRPSLDRPFDRKISSPKAKFSAYIYACNVCGKQYTNKSNCKRHMRIHTDEEKLYECEFCGKRFSQKYEVKMHARIHTGEKPFSCAVCGKNFTERGNWRRHTQIHVRPQEASPYRCGICCKGFFHADKLQVHLQIHSGQRPFICTVCGRKVKKIGDMYRHLRTHTGEKPYKCQVCGKGFAQNGNLKDHMKMHTGEKPHVCDLCGKDFARKVLLKEHIKNHHKGTTLQDLTEAALEEIERQEAAMDTIDTTLEEAVVHEITSGNVPKILSATNLGKTIVIGGPSNSSTDEAQLLHEEQELELQDVHATLTEKELEAAHVLTVVQDGDNMIYAYNVNSDQSQPIIVNAGTEHAGQQIVVKSDQEQHIVVTTEEPDSKHIVMETTELEVQNN